MFSLPPIFQPTNFVRGDFHRYYGWFDGLNSALEGVKIQILHIEKSKKKLNFAGI